MYSMGQAINDLKNFYGLKDFHNVNLNIEDEDKPFIKFKSKGTTWILSLEKEKINEWTNKWQYKAYCKKMCLQVYNGCSGAQT